MTSNDVKSYLIVFLDEARRIGPSLAIFRDGPRFKLMSQSVSLHTIPPYRRPPGFLSTWFRSLFPVLPFVRNTAVN